MGKKRNKKNSKKKQKRYNKSQFTDIICENCGVCPSPNPTFCYDAYKSDPKVFIDKCYMALIKLSIYLNRTGGNVELNGFIKTFCYSGLCGANRNSQQSCKNLTKCYNEFGKQRIGEGTGLAFPNKKQRKRNRKREETVFVAYPTFFSSDNEKFKAKIEEILTNGD